MEEAKRQTTLQEYIDCQQWERAVEVAMSKEERKRILEARTFKGASTLASTLLACLQPPAPPRPPSALLPELPASGPAR